MPTTTSAFWRDGNRVPITGNGLMALKSITLTGDQATVNVPIFTVTGSVEVLALYGVITTDFGSNHTAAAWRINDQTAQVYLTAVGGTTLSSKKAGSLIVKKDVASAALTLVDNVAGAISEPTTLETFFFSPVVIVKKTAALTQIEYHYATTNHPTTGAIEFFCGYLPLSEDGAVDPA